MSAPTIVPLCDLMAAPITPDDLDFELDSEEQHTMDTFEVAWKNFMQEHPELVPEGKREKNIKQLQKQAKLTMKAQTQVNEELQKQLDFFEESRQRLEEDFEKEIEATRTSQKNTHESLQRKQDSIGMAEHLLSQSIQWEHFLACVDKAAEQAKWEGTLMTLFNKTSRGEKDKNVKPSDRAMYLLESTSGDEAGDVELKAYQIDHALLNTRVKMLQKEAEGYEKLLETQKMVGKFLDDNNVWTMVSKPAGVGVM